MRRTTLATTPRHQPRESVLDIRVFAPTGPQKFMEPTLWNALFRSFEHFRHTAIQDHEAKPRQKSKSTIRCSRPIFTYLVLILVYAGNAQNGVAKQRRVKRDQKKGPEHGPTVVSSKAPRLWIQCVQSEQIHTCIHSIEAVVSQLEYWEHKTL